MESREWDIHYTRGKSALTYPDENLVRLLGHELTSRKATGLRALDTGCGSGRHLFLLENRGMEFSAGTDYSLNALEICRASGQKLLVNCDNRALPFRDSSFDIVIAWGSLHYSLKDETRAMASELLRITAPGGVLFATLRRDNDTYLRTGEHLGNNVWRTKLDDLEGSTVSFYSEDEVKLIFSGFGELKYGFMERSIVGDRSKVISHWVISARR
ncbi:MAG TPA: class I SAM-dependent methyltransferase [Spirochaetota bacterium]|nr:class I SAM-dependent methyltransferase [Spirochaetota bacterium]HQO39482.1 class I SAM-dependent methyltransferase [Spirochaetota bacterium]